MKALLTLSAAVLAAAATTVPAVGQVRPDDRAGIRGPGGSTPDPVLTIAVRPDDRAGIRRPGRSIAEPARSVQHVRPDDRSGVRGVGLVTAPIESPAVIRVDRPGFDWNDAGIGAAAGAGLMLLLLGASRLIRLARSDPRPA
jgi:hypothetical protein